MSSSSYIPSYAPVSTGSDSFTRKAIEVQFDVVNPSGGTDTVIIPEGHRIRAGIAHAGLSSGSELNMEIWGLSQNTMNRLCFVENLPNATSPLFRNQSDTNVIVRAGDYGGSKQTIFSGNAVRSYAKYGPGEPYIVNAVSNSALNGFFGEPVSYPGAWSVPGILSDLAVRAGCGFVDHGGWGRNSTLIDHVAQGALIDQIESVIDASLGSFNFVAGGGYGHRGGLSANDILHVWGPSYRGSISADKLKTMPVISKESGLLGYPEYTAYGMKLRSIFRPDILFFTPFLAVSNYIPYAWAYTDQDGFNGKGQRIATGRQPWDGAWLPYMITHDLSTETPKGPWDTTIECQRSDVGTSYGLK